MASILPADPTLDEIRAEIAELQRQEDEANALDASQDAEAQPE